MLGEGLLPQRTCAEVGVCVSSSLYNHICCITGALSWLHLNLIRSGKNKDALFGGPLPLNTGSSSQKKLAKKKKMTSKIKRKKENYLWIFTAKEWSWIVTVHTMSHKMNQDIKELKTMKLFRRKHRGKSSWHWIWQWFLGYDTRKAQATQEKNKINQTPKS